MKQNYISHFFKKESEDINENDIVAFFSNRQEETSNLEFKSGDSEIHDIFKEVAAFLNTEGGLLIIGSPIESKEQRGKLTIRYCQGQLTYSKFQSKDWLYQRIFSNITPSPTNIFIREIQNKNGMIFLIEVPQSQHPPHQSNADGRYYIRIDNEAKPAPHGLVQALFEKRNKPQLIAKFERTPLNINTELVNIRLQNLSTTPADKVSFIIDVFNVDNISDNNFVSSNEANFGQKFSASINTNQVLVRVISVGHTFKVKTRNQKYLVAIYYWSKDSDFDGILFLIDPNKNTVTAKDVFQDDLLEVIKTLQQ